MKKKEKKVPTNEEVKKEIETLRAMKPKIQQSSLFGNDNHAQIDAEIKVMEKHLEGETMDDCDIDDKLDSHEWTDDEASSARNVVSWLEGDEDESPSDNWKVLAK